MRYPYWIRTATISAIVLLAMHVACFAQSLAGNTENEFGARFYYPTTLTTSVDSNWFGIQSNYRISHFSSVEDIFKNNYEGLVATVGARSEFSESPAWFQGCSNECGRALNPRDTFSLKFGYVIDSILPYVTGSISAINGPNSLIGIEVPRGTLFGYSVGAGFKIALPNDASLGFEYHHSQTDCASSCVLFAGTAPRDDAVQLQLVLPFGVSTSTSKPEPKPQPAPQTPFLPPRVPGPQ